MKSLNSKTIIEGDARDTKIMVKSAEIVVHGTADKPYYEIKYCEVGEEEYHIGYSSYNLAYVFKWLHKYFEIVD